MLCELFKLCKLRYSFVSPTQGHLDSGCPQMSFLVKNFPDREIHACGRAYLLWRLQTRHVCIMLMLHF